MRGHRSAQLLLDEARAYLICGTFGKRARWQRKSSERDRALNKHPRLSIAQHGVHNPVCLNNDNNSRCVLIATVKFTRLQRNSKISFPERGSSGILRKRQTTQNERVAIVPHFVIVIDQRSREMASCNNVRCRKTSRIGNKLRRLRGEYCAAAIENSANESRRSIGW